MIKRAEEKDIAAIANLAAMMWSNHSAEELNNEFSDLFMEEEAQFFLKYENDIPVGFAQCQLRHDYVAVSYTHLCVSRARTAALSKSSPSFRAVIGFVLSGVR